MPPVWWRRVAQDRCTIELLHAAVERTDAKLGLDPVHERPAPDTARAAKLIRGPALIVQLCPAS